MNNQKANNMKQKKKYDIALSFAGEDRKYVEKVAYLLEQNQIRSFYDKLEEDNLWGKNLYDYLSDIYQNQAKYTIIFISESYSKKRWTNHERQSAQARAFQESQEYILPARFDDTIVPGILDTTGYIDLRTKTPEEFVEIIKKKLKYRGETIISDDIESDLKSKSNMDLQSDFKTKREIDTKIRKSTIKKTSDESANYIVRYETDPKIRKLAVEKTSDDSVFDYVVRYETNPEIKKLAVKRTSDNGILDYVMRYETNLEIKKLAVEKTSDKSTLDYVMRYETDPEIKKLALQRLIN